MQTIYPRPAIAYQGTITGLRVSAVDGGGTASGGAFIDNAGATIPTLADGAHLIEIYDSSNRKLSGVLKAAGAEETFNELLPNTAFDNTTGVTGENCTVASVEGGQAGNCLQITRTGGGYQSGYETILEAAGVAIGKLFYFGMYVKSGSSLDESGKISMNKGVSAALIKDIGFTSSTTWTLYSAYQTYPVLPTAPLNIVIQGYKLTATDGTMLFDTASCKQVLTPSTSGATIVSQKAGTLFNFSYKNASFAYNQASYYVVVRLLR
jgi:hypothetical protein